MVETGQASPVPHVTAIVPTYCEADSLPRLLPRLLDVLCELEPRCEVLIVDDDSPDATAAVCQPFIDTGKVRLITRRNERGLARAVLHGLTQARGEWVVVMDADLSHPPEAIPRMLAALEDGADMVLGSRYVPGGSTSDQWTTSRWVHSKIATMLVRPLTSARDPMAGFLAIRRDRVQRRLHELNPLGYKIALELMVKCGCRRVDEVPIHFEHRVHGTSKLDLREKVTYLRHVTRLYLYCIGRRLRGPGAEDLEGPTDDARQRAR